MVRCEHPINFEEDDPILDIYYGVIYEYPTDISVKEITLNNNGLEQCACALRTDNRIQCWGHEDCHEISDYFSGEYLSVSSNSLLCAITLDGRVVLLLQQNVDYQINSHHFKNIKKWCMCPQNKWSDRLY